MSKEHLNVYVDGAARNNPGPGGIGIVIKKDGKTEVEIGEYIGKVTNNVAEYTALIRGMEETLLLGCRDAKFHSDSELLVKQINGEYKVKEEHLKSLYIHAQTLIRKFEKFSISHTYREENKHADRLANQGIDRHSTEDSPLFTNI